MMHERQNRSCGTVRKCTGGQIRLPPEAVETHRARILGRSKPVPGCLRADSNGSRTGFRARRRPEHSA